MSAVLVYIGQGLYFGPKKRDLLGIDPSCWICGEMYLRSEYLYALLSKSEICIPRDPKYYIQVSKEELCLSVHCYPVEKYIIPNKKLSHWVSLINFCKEHIIYLRIMDISC